MENPIPEGLGSAAAAQVKGKGAARQRLWDCRWMSVASHTGRCFGAMQQATVYFHCECR